MKRRGDLQFSHSEDAESDFMSHQVHGYASNSDDDVLAKVTIEMPKAKVQMDYGTSWEDIGQPPKPAAPTVELNGQLRMPIIEQPAKVSWALANQEGRAAAAPHKLIAALSEEHNVRPVADSTLSPQGSAMSRSAARRGLIQGHPSNPSMEANIPSLYPGDPHIAENAINETLEDNREYDWENSRPVFNEQQMSRAHQRVFGSRRKDRTPEPPAEQPSLF